MQNQRDPHIDSQIIDSYQQDGVVLLKGVFRPWIESLAAGVAELMANPSEYGHARTVVPKDGSAPFFQDYCNWSRIPDFERFVLHSPAAEIAAALMQSKTATFFHEHTLVKPPGGITISPIIASKGSKTSASGSRWTRWRKRSRCAASAVPTAGATSSAQPVLTAQSFTHTAVLKSCRILMRIRTITILLAGRWSREMPSPFITGRCTARGAMRPRARGGLSPLAGSGMTPPSPIAAESPRRRSRS